ncbi:PH-like domain-containing protein [Cellulomonas timonensis]|uniref:PH-like domain-containing protein n=1 Tax=Cellulomonas timonensis TaxID=1689271 RepID=UPI001F465A64|nr:hypothetical protein [Cellulomonas timonensis]
MTIVVLVALGALVLWSMRRGWRSRGVSTAAVVPDLPATPAEGLRGAPVTEPMEATYISSTRAGDWLDRVVAHDLGVRSAAQAQVFERGVLLTRRGAADVWVPSQSLRSVGTTSGMAGKYVGGDGIVVLTWALEGDERGLDTGVRPRRSQDRTRLLEAARGLIDPTSPVAQKEQQ